MKLLEQNNYKVTTEGKLAEKPHDAYYRDTSIFLIVSNLNVAFLEQTFG